jgi:SpoVK/Ycf46/Vps4 family AAA+-type ATPase
MVVTGNIGVQTNASFESSLEHLLAELKRIELKLRLRITSIRQNETAADSKFKGLCISEKEIDDILESPGLQSKPELAGRQTPASKATGDLIRRLETDIAAKKEEALNRGQVLRLVRLETLFGLSRFDLDILLLCLLPELDLKYQTLYAYLQDDITRKIPNIDLVLHLLCDSFDGTLAARATFSPQAPLMKHHLIRLCDERSGQPAPLLARCVQVDERITGYLLDSDQMDARLLGLVGQSHPGTKLKDMVLLEDVRIRLQKLISQFGGDAFICYLFGTYGVGKKATAEAVCAEMGIPLLNVDLNAITGLETPIEVLVPLVLRESRLQGAALYFNDFDILFSDDKRTGHAYHELLGSLREYPNWVFLSGEKEWRPKEILWNKPCISIELSPASYEERRQIWEKQLEEKTGFSPDISISDLASKFRLSGGQIHDVMCTAKNLARWRDPGNGLVTSEDLYSACRKQAREALSALARKIQPAYHWIDIILPKDQFDQLHEICAYVEHYHKVYGEWGFGRKVSVGKGLNALFAGPSGTGKTMAAEIIANELKIDLYKIDLSSIVSKYIGETEKNLDHIFREGRTSNAILFFDEADALFGKRSEVRDSHDRYANIEIAYLLQKMDEYDGIVILATNLRKNMDEAFARRMHYTLEFPIPEEPDRYRIWTHIFPEEAPLSPDTDLRFMARQFKITGGNIKNIALNAAFLSAQDQSAISMRHLIRATKREYQKIGKLCTEEDFARFFDVVKS